MTTRRSEAIESLWRFVLVLALAGWWGGLTFYSLVVVPEGTEQLGRQAQGLITQQVTRSLNWVGIAVATLVLFELKRARSRRGWLLWIVFALSQVALLALHQWLTSLLEAEFSQGLDHAHFYSVHRVYLLGTAAQWGCGGGLLWSLLWSWRGRSEQPAESGL